MLAQNLWGCANVPGFRCDNCGLIVLHPSRGSGPMKHEQIVCPQCGKVYPFAHATLSEDGSLHCPACGSDFLIADIERQ